MGKQTKNKRRCVESTDKVLYLPTYRFINDEKKTQPVRDRSVAYVTDSQGNVYETRGTSVSGLPPMHSREGERIFSNDVIDQGYPTRGNDSAMYNIGMGQSPSHRLVPKLGHDYDKVKP